MKINVMKENEVFLGLMNDAIVLRCADGSGRIVPIIKDKNGTWVDKDNEIIIGFGNGTIEVTDEDNEIELVTF